MLLPVLVHATFRSKAIGLFQLNAEWGRRGLQKPLMYSQTAIPAGGQVVHDRCQISLALMVLKNVSMTALS